MLHHALARSFLVWFWLTGALLSVSSLSLRGAEPVTHDFDVPGGEARPMLQRFAAQANVEIVFPVDSVRGIRTNAVKGRMTVRDAIGRMLSSTGLVAAFDEATGAIAVRVDGRRASSATTAATAVAKATTAPNAGEREVAAGSGPASATISGQVSNAATKAYLEGAVVEWLGTGRSVTTDRNGQYRFTGVSTDQVVLAVSFTGLDSQRLVVPLQPGANVVRDVALTSDVYQLEKFTVAGEREGTARSEVLQRMAPNVKSVISSDTFGNIADGNIGDLLQRMPGITGEYNGTDVRQVSIRGVTSNLNSVTMDGQQVADSQSAGTGRGFEFQAVSMANIESIEVTKAPTPDMDGASIGGSVNLVSKSAFDRAPGRVFTYTVGFATRDGYSGSPDRSWKEPVKGFGPSLSFGYSDLVGARRNLGITFTGTLHSQPGGGMTLANQYERRATPGPVFNYSTTRQTGGFGTTRSRYALALKLDYKWSEHTTMAFNTSYNFFNANNDTRTHQLATTGTVSAANPQVLATVDAGGNRIGGGFIAPGYTSDFTRVFAGPRSLSTITINSFDKTVRTYLFAPSFRHRYDGLSIDYNFTYSNSATYQDVSHRGEKYHAAPTGTITLELPNIGWTVDRAGNSTWPTIRQVQGPDLYDVGNYGNLLLTQIDLRGYDSILGAKFDLKKDLRLALPTYLKSGFTYQRQTRKVWQDPRRFRFAGADGVLGNADDSTGIRAFAYTGEPTEEEERFLAGRGGIPAWVDPRLVAQNQVDQPQRWIEDVAFTSGKLTSYRHMQEDIAAAYIMGNVRYRDLSLLTGVRVEQTRGDGEGALSYISPEERARRAAWTGPLTDAEILRRNLAQYGTRATNEGKYNSVLPGVHLKYEPFRGFVGRLSWSTGIGRPPFGNIVPNTVINDEARSISVTNPELKPQRANNYDFSAEYYFRRQGMVSVGFFRKEITDYIDTDSSQVVAAGEDNGFDGEFVGYRVNTSRNNGEATIEGMEISYQQQLSFLPGWARGLGVYGNFTKLRTEGNNSAFRTGATVSNSGTLAGFLNESGNIGVSYRGYDLELRLQAVYRGEYLISNSTDPSQRVYQRSKVTWAWKSRYNLSRHVGLFLDLENLFAQPLDHTFAAYRDRPTTYRTFHTKIVGGLTGRF